MKKCSCGRRRERNQAITPSEPSSDSFGVCRHADRLFHAPFSHVCDRSIRLGSMLPKTSAERRCSFACSACKLLFRAFFYFASVSLMAILALLHPCTVEVEHVC